MFQLRFAPKFFPIKILKNKWLDINGYQKKKKKKERHKRHNLMMFIQINFQIGNIIDCFSDQLNIIQR